jgi:hypothetical protein
MDGSATETGPSSWLEQPTGFAPKETLPARSGNGGWVGSGPPQADIFVLQCAVLALRSGSSMSSALAHLRTRGAMG